MLEDQHPPFAQQTAPQHQVNHLPALLQIVGGVGEDQVEAFGAGLQIEEGVGLDGEEIANSQLAAVWRMKLWWTLLISTEVTLRTRARQIHS